MFGARGVWKKEPSPQNLSLVSEPNSHLAQEGSVTPIEGSASKGRAVNADLD